MNKKRIVSLILALTILFQSLSLPVYAIDRDQYDQRLAQRSIEYKEGIYQADLYRLDPEKIRLADPKKAYGLRIYWSWENVKEGFGYRIKLDDHIQLAETFVEKNTYLDQANLAQSDFPYKNQFNSHIQEFNKEEEIRQEGYLGQALDANNLPALDVYYRNGYLDLVPLENVDSSFGDLFLGGVDLLHLEDFYGEDVDQSIEKILKLEITEIPVEQMTEEENLAETQEKNLESENTLGLFANPLFSRKQKNENTTLEINSQETEEPIEEKNLLEKAKDLFEIENQKPQIIDLDLEKIIDLKTESLERVYIIEENLEEEILGADHQGQNMDPQILNLDENNEIVLELPGEKETEEKALPEENFEQIETKETDNIIEETTEEENNAGEDEAIIEEPNIIEENSQPIEENFEEENQQNPQEEIVRDENSIFNPDTEEKSIITKAEKPAEEKSIITKADQPLRANSIRKKAPVEKPEEKAPVENKIEREIEKQPVEKTDLEKSLDQERPKEKLEEKESLPWTDLLPAESNEDQLSDFPEEEEIVVNGLINLRDQYIKIKAEKGQELFLVDLDQEDPLLGQMTLDQTNNLRPLEEKITSYKADENGNLNIALAPGSYDLIAGEESYHIDLREKLEETFYAFDMTDYNIDRPLELLVDGEEITDPEYVLDLTATDDKLIKVAIAIRKVMDMLDKEELAEEDIKNFQTSYKLKDSQIKAAYDLAKENTLEDLEKMAQEEKVDPEISAQELEAAIAIRIAMDNLIELAGTDELGEETIKNFQATYELTEDQIKAAYELAKNHSLEELEQMAKGLAEKENRGLEISEEDPQAVGAGNLNLDGKKFIVRTIFKTSNAGGPIQDYQYFKIHLDEKLTVNDENSLEPIIYNGRVIANPTYNKDDNTITYNIVGTIPENIEVPLNIPVDYNTEKIKLEKDGTFTVTNKVSGLGVKAPKDLVPQKIDKNGNPAGSIIEPDRHDVIKIFDDENDRNYSVDIDANGTPIVEQGELLGFNWAVKVHSTDDLKDLGFKLNLTAVKGSGLKEIQNVMINGQTVKLTDQLEGAFGIVDSKHHNLENSTNDITYNFYTPVDRKQSSYMLDISGILTNKNNKLGAARIVLNEGYELDAISEATSTRIGMNNRTTIQGKFDTKDTATWTVTDGVSSGDEAEQNTIQGLPLETRSLGGSQTLNSANRAVYGIDLESGQMVSKLDKAPINTVAIPEKAKDPAGAQAVGNIAVYEFGTNLTDAGDDETKAKDYSLGGVSISKYKDIVVEQIWNLPEGGKMPAQTIEVKDQGTDKVVASIEVGEETGNTRLIRIPDVKFWDFDDKGVYIAKKLYIDQNLPTDQVSIGGNNYKYYENANYYQEDIKVYQIRNAAIEVDDKTPGSFKIVKIDKEKDEKGNPIKLPGAKFSLLGANVEVVTDKNGEATFTNIQPGDYYLIENKAPEGYKLDQDRKNVTITSDGNVIIKGKNAGFSTGTGASGIVEHNNAPNWPDFMNTMHYSTVDQNGNSVLYVYLKPRAQEAGGSTNKDTVFNINLPGVSLGDNNVDVYDIDPYYRSYYRSALEDGTIENAYFGADVINQYSPYSQTISGASTQDGGYQIKFPSSRFGNDWGFMVKVTANLGDKESETLNYKWEVDGNPNDSHIDQKVTLNKTKQAKGIPTVTITNEAFEKSEIEVTKFANSFSEVEENGKKVQKRTRLPGAEFVLKDNEGNLIANKVTDENGHVSFGEFPPGVYRLEEVSAPNGYQKSNVYFEVTVNDSKEVSYVAKFLSGSGQPVIGVDYWIEKGDETQTDNKATVTSVNQRLEYNENKETSWGTKTEVWEAYMFESLKYHADITLNNVSPGSRFEIQFDPNLDFTQYFSDFPKIRKDGKDIADPYFDYNTNLLTYVFNNNSQSYATTTVTIDLKGMIPDKYYFQNSGTKNFSVTVAPGTTGENKISRNINADYGSYDTAFGQPSQSYYFRDIYKGDDGEWYVTAIAYFNPLADSTATKTLQFNWMSTNYDKTKLIARQEGKGYKPAFDLVDVKVYETEPNLGSVKVPGSDYSVPVNYNMPLSFGVRPEQDPNTYTLLYSTGINPEEGTTSSQNGVTLEYDPSKIITSGGIHTSYPLRVKLPPISGKKEGFIVEQKFKVTDMKNFINLSRMFYMNNGTTYKKYGFESAFTNSANFNTASADQTGVEIPQYYKEVVGLINRQYKPGNFKITKLNQADKDDKLSGAIFVLRPENGNPIYRTSDTNGEVSFEGLAPGRYVLDEFRAPTGFQKTDKQWQVIVFNDGNVRITESSITGSDQVYQGNEINIEVTNKPEGEDFVVYKKDGSGQPLSNAEFKLTKQGDATFEKTATSDSNGLVKFGELQNGTYIIEEITPPEGYKKLNQKWVLVIDADGKRIYNYRDRTSGDQNENLLSEESTKWINVKDRSKDGWGYNDNRTTGWVANSTRPFKLGTRIVAINKSPGEGKQPYVIQRYVLNPEAAKIDATSATIHRENPHDPNMNWYAGTEEYKVYKLEKPVTGFISDMRLDDFGATDITESVSKSAQSVDGKYGEPQRLKLDFPATDKPIVIDVKIPYTNEDGGVGTGMDWTEDGTTYWKSDFYESVDIIKEAGLVNPTTEDGQTSIIGAYISENSLDVTNELQTYGFKIKKVNDNEENPQAVPGAKFKLTDSEGNAKEMITGSDGMISFDGLKPGTYTLEETQAASGYEKSNITWTVRITNDGKAYIKANPTEETESNANLSVVKLESTNDNQAQGLRTMAFRSQDLTTTLKLNPQSATALALDENLSLATNLPGKILEEYMTGKQPQNLENQIQNVETNISAEFSNVENDSKAENDGLEIGEEIVPEAQRAGEGWQVVNPDKSTIASHQDEDGIQTKITKINKDTKEFTQVFLIDGSKSKQKPIMFNLRGADGSNSSLGRVQVNQATYTSTIDNIVTSKSIDHNGPFDDGNIGGQNITFTKTNNKYVVEITTSYTDNQKLGFEGRFIYDRTGKPNQWKHADAKESYNSANDINKEETTYKVTPNVQKNGTVTADPNQNIKAGQTVTLTLKPNNGFVLKTLEVNSTKGTVQTNKVNDTTYTFTMPASDVGVNVYFEEKQAETYSITVNSSQNGSVTAQPQSPKANETVTLTVSPEEGFKLDNLSVTDDNRQTVNVDMTNYTFTMPASNVTVSASFRKVEDPTPETYNVTVTQPTEGGSISTNTTSAAEGAEVTLTATPDKGYVLDKFKVTDANNQPVAVNGNKFTMPAGDVTVSATFKKIDDTPDPDDGWKEITAGSAAQITNKQVGLDFKVFKSDIRQRPLEGAEFELFKADENYNITEENDAEGNPIASITGLSGEDGNVKFVDKDGNPAKLQPGYYVMRETKAPQGYKKITADWKIRVYEDGGILKAEYKGPTDTPSSYLSSKSANDKNTMDTQGNVVLKDAGSGIKYASRINYIDTKSKTFVQRIYIDTRGYTGNEKVNVEITPVIKREEIDTPGKPPVTTEEGVKTAYRTTYKIGSPNTNTDVTNGNYEQILRFYDLADDNVSMINTARWRPFDWGFDEDQINLDKGVYFIDVEGFYDDNITEEEIGKIEMYVKFQTERYFYSQAKDENGNFYWKKDGSYLDGAAALGGVYEEDVIDPTTGEVIHKKGDPTEWGKKLSTDGKYPNWIGKEVVWTNGQTYKTGKIDVPEGVTDKTLGEVTTSIDIKTLYSSDGVNQIDQEGMDIINDEETYNITFTKHGQNSSDEDINSEAVTERRLEGGVFKLQEEIAPNIYRDLPESTVASAFNGYFGFRGLQPGRYRLIEVQPPKDYKPITGPLLYFTVETIKTNSGKIVHPETGQIVDIKSIQIKFSDDDKEAHKLEDLQMLNAEGNRVNIKDVKSSDINVETTKIINPHTNTEVFLKDQKIVGDNGNYDIAQAKIVPGSSGYVSLEYDRANGVYQYVPEKTTSEKDGKLVDFVTSGTAKNMGKIINTKPGEGEVTVKKVDQSGDEIKATDLRPGAQFKLTNKLNGTTETKTVGEDGTIKFENLPIGQYQLEEIKSPDGYINNKQIWNFTVGGEGLDPYSGPAPQRRQDLSDKITLTSTMKVLNPENKDHVATKVGEIHPHLGEAFEFDNKFKIAEGTKINPGDYFTIKLTDNIDLDGIFENNVEELDIFADGIGTVAKADYNKDAGTITYTFTDYANTYTLTDFSNKLSAFINLDKVQNSDTDSNKQQVGLSLGNNTKIENIKVVYDSMTARENNYYDYLNLGSKIIKFNPETGEFVHYYYINRDQTNAMNGPVKFQYSSEQNIENFNIGYYLLVDKEEKVIKEVMPESFGVNEYSTDLPSFTTLNRPNNIKANYPVTLDFTGGIRSGQSYIVKVTGKVSDENKMAYVGHGKLERVFNHPDNFLYVNRHDKVYGFVNSATADGKLEIQAVNPENKIKFIKVDHDNKPLSGATFTLYIQNSEGTWDVYTDGVKESGTDGIVEYSKLKPGKYKIEETKAPTDYDKIEGSILEFEVDASGRILRDRLKSEEPETKAPDSTDESSQGTTVDTNPVKIEEPGIEPIPVVNKKKQEISFKKVDATDNTKTLEGAEFEVWHKLEKTDEYSQLNIYEKKLEDGTTERLALRATEAPAGYTAVTGNKLTSGKDGLVKFGFYDSGYYALKETKAPKGYIAPREYVREFVVVDGKIQESVLKTEMEVNKTIGTYYDGSNRQDVYNTDITLRINPDHEKITYTKGKSKITLSGLPYDNDLAVSNTNITKYGISIYAKLVNKDNKSSSSKYYPVNLKNYTNDKGSIEIDLYDLVGKIEGKTDDSFESENTIELKMYSTLALGTTLDITSNLVIGEGEDAISEERTFEIGTKGDEKVDHSYTFTNLGEPKLPIQIENRKAEYPWTGGPGTVVFSLLGVGLMTAAAYVYRRKREVSYGE